MKIYLQEISLAGRLPLQVRPIGREARAPALLCLIVKKMRIRPLKSVEGSETGDYLSAMTEVQEFLSAYSP